MSLPKPSLEERIANLEAKVITAKPFVKPQSRHGPIIPWNKYGYYVFWITLIIYMLGCFFFFDATKLGLFENIVAIICTGIVTSVLLLCLQTDM